MIASIGLIFRSRLGQVVLAILAGVLIYNLWVYVLHKRWVVAEQGKAAIEVLEKTQEVQENAEERKKKVERMAPGDLLKYWGGGRVQSDNSKGGATAPVQ